MFSHKLIFSFLFGVFLLLSCSSKPSCDNRQLLEAGEITADLVYENKALGLSLKLPANWYLLDNSGLYTKSAPVNAEIVKALQPKDITLGELKQLAEDNQEAIHILLALSDREVNGEVSEYDKPEPPAGAFALLLEPSATGSAEGDAEYHINLLKESLKRNPEYQSLNEKGLTTGQEMAFGKQEKIPFYTLTYPVDDNGFERHKRFGIRNFGCYNLLIAIDYSTEEDLAKILKLLGKV